MLFEPYVPIARSVEADAKNTFPGPFKEPVPEKPDELIPKSPYPVVDVPLLLETT